MKKLYIAIIIIIVGVFAVAGIAFGVHKYSQNKANAASEESPIVTNEEAASATEVVPEKDYGIADSDPLKDIKLSLIVDLDRQTLEGMYADFIRDFLDSSMPNRNDERTSAASKVGWGKEGNKMYDAVSFPFSEVQKDKKEYSDSDIDAMYLELQE